MTKSPGLIDGERIRKAHSVRRVEPIQERLAVALGTIPQLRYMKLFPERLAASNVVSADGKKNPVVQIGAEGLVGVELLIDSKTQVVQFYGLTSAERGCGRKIVEPRAVLRKGTDDIPQRGRVTRLDSDRPRRALEASRNRRNRGEILVGAAGIEPATPAV